MEPAGRRAFTASVCRNIMASWEIFCVDDAWIATIARSIAEMDLARFFFEGETAEHKSAAKVYSPTFPA